MRKSLGNKRNELTPDHIAEITALYEDFTEGDRSKVLPNSAFGYRKVTVERPLRIRYEISDDTISAVEAGKAFARFDDGTQAVVREAFANLTGTIATTLEQFEKVIVPETVKVRTDHGWDTDEGAIGDLAWSLGITKAHGKALLADLTVPDPEGDPVTDRKGVVQRDPSLRDTEVIPLDEDVDAFIEREVLPYAPDAWLDHDKTKVGYDIPFTRHFYRYALPRPLAEIDADIKASQQRILKLLAEVTEPASSRPWFPGSPVISAPRAGRCRVRTTWRDGPSRSGDRGRRGMALRHRLASDPIQATGLRAGVPEASLGGKRHRAAP